MSIPDSVLAAIIAGTATLSASFVQLRSALLRDAAGRPASRRRNRLQLIILLAVIGASGVCGFALSQWLTSGERAAQSVMQHELQARVAEISHTAGELELTRGSQRAEIEAGVLRQLGSEGIVVMATVPACHQLPTPVSGPAASSGTPAAPPATTEAAAPARPCSEAEASPMTLCATVPAAANVIEVALFSRVADSTTPWSASRYLPGQESGEARFSPTYAESTPESGTRQVCQGFAHWSSDHARTVRMVVRYTLPS